MNVVNRLVVATAVSRRSNYRDSYAYQDANYGYGCFNVERDDDNY